MFSTAYYLPMDRVSILKALIDGTYGGSQADFARAIKRSPAQINQWLQGVRSVGDASARHIENTLNLGSRYFDGAPVKDLPSAPIPIDPGDEFVAVARVSIRVSAGVTGFRVEHIDGHGQPIFFRADWLAARGLKASRLYALKVIGDSMEPNLWADDLVVINSADTAPKDGEVFVANYEGEVVIKRLRRDAGEWWLESDNPRHKPKRCDEHAELIGRVIYRQTERI